MTKLQHIFTSVFVLVNVTGVVFASTNAIAQDNTTTQDNTSNQNTEVTSIRTSEISGDITKIDGGKITILDMDGRANEYNINDSIKITRDTNIIKSDQLRVGDKVKVIIDSDKNSLIGLDAISGGVIDTAKYTIPAIILGIILVGLIIYAVKKTKQGQILTSSETSNR